MKGNNSINFNQSTMIDIVQFWLDSRWKLKEGESLVVTKVKQSNSGGGQGFVPEFTVETDSEIKT